uniref:Uncharacterized protein n=1 Tax=Branchiostoma floridae TaxID=7739 RepID=C3ZJR9_BRAFL|eukprot:XP_002591193.1 hypothetical protein BRAFLDRAFT_105395 [Branchiostoma floridae]
MLRLNRIADHFLTTLAEDKAAQDWMRTYATYWNRIDIEDKLSDDDECAVCRYILTHDPVVSNMNVEAAVLQCDEIFCKNVDLDDIGMRRPHTSVGVIVAWYQFTKTFNIPPMESIHLINPRSVAFHFLIRCCTLAFSDGGSPLLLFQSAFRNIIKLRRQGAANASTVEEEGAGNEVPKDRLGDVADAEDVLEIVDDEDVDKKYKKAELRAMLAPIRELVGVLLKSCYDRQIYVGNDEGVQGVPCVMADNGDIRHQLQLKQLYDDARYYVSRKFCENRTCIDYMTFMHPDNYAIYQPGLMLADPTGIMGEAADTEIMTKVTQREDEDELNLVPKPKVLYGPKDARDTPIISLHEIATSKTITADQIMTRSERIRALDEATATAVKKLVSRMHAIARLHYHVTNDGGCFDDVKFIFHKCLWCSMDMIPGWCLVLNDLHVMACDKIKRLGLYQLKPSHVKMDSLSEKQQLNIKVAMDKANKGRKGRVGIDGQKLRGVKHFKTGYVSKSLGRGVRHGDKRHNVGVRSQNAQDLTKLFEEGDLVRGNDSGMACSVSPVLDDDVFFAPKQPVVRTGKTKTFFRDRSTSCSTIPFERASLNNSLSPMCQNRCCVSKPSFTIHMMVPSIPEQQLDNIERKIAELERLRARLKNVVRDDRRHMGTVDPPTTKDTEWDQLVSEQSAEINNEVRMFLCNIRCMGKDAGIIQSKDDHYQDFAARLNPILLETVNRAISLSSAQRGEPKTHRVSSRDGVSTSSSSLSYSCSQDDSKGMDYHHYANIPLRQSSQPVSVTRCRNRHTFSHTQRKCDPLGSTTGTGSCDDRVVYADLDW